MPGRFLIRNTCQRVQYISRRGGGVRSSAVCVHVRRGRGAGASAAARAGAHAAAWAARHLQAERLQDVELADRTRALLEQPLVDAVLVILMSAHTRAQSICPENAYPKS